MQFSEGEPALLIDSKGRRFLLKLESGRSFQFHNGVVPHDELIGADGEPISAFAATLSNLAESDLQVVRELNVGGKAPTAVAGFQAGVRQELWLYLILAALGISFLEWFSYHRRVTV